MQKKVNNPDSSSFPSDAQELAQELDSLRGLILASARSGSKDENTLALTRLLPGISEEQWNEVANEHGLSDWLALTLSGSAYQNVQQLQNALESLAHQSEHDAMTGLPNRRSFERQLEVELDRVERSQGQVSLAILDIDHFKQVNDTYGHPCGDIVLEKLAQVLSTSKRAYDVAARIGGEEFALILPGASPTKAKAMLERVLMRFAGIEHSCENAEPFCCTFSAGVAAVKGRSKTTGAELVALADKALYSAKNNGRNQVHVARLRVEAEIDRTTMVHSNEKQFLFSVPE